ncbi:MAG TPA: LLM class F420-dependent oxidoreductase [Fimbriimonadaceae bacterium]|jgi:probable F420-dependent oxidoreductase|nr:LLM class F420-dependent oxidoreductase [Fimbriimonadaceae bacterium]
MKVGVQIHPQHTSVDELRAAWKNADALGVDSIWTWDHFFPLWGPPDGAHFEGWTLLSAMAVDTKHATVGILVSSNSYRNPDLLADMARTVDHLSGGRAVLGMGAGWFERDYAEYGFEFGTSKERLKRLRDALPRIRSRLQKLEPSPLGDLPLLIGGGGERVTLRLVAEYAQMWNFFGPPDNYHRKAQVLDRWCERLGRDPGSIERTVLIDADEVNDHKAYLEAGAEHLIVKIGHPYDLEPLRILLEQRELTR